MFSKISIGIFIMVLTACSDRSENVSLPYYNTPDFSPQFLARNVSPKEKINHTIANFSFTDQNGNAITEKDIDRKIHVANFIFTSCISICPVMTKNMKIVEQEFRDNKDVALLSFSVTPWIDDVMRLHQFAKKNQISASNWHLLTGKKSEIYTLARTSYFAEEDIGFTKDSTQFLHTEHILLIDKTKRIRGIYNGTLELEARQLVKDIHLLLMEK